jgi:hypothetical protein
MKRMLLPLLMFACSTDSGSTSATGEIQVTISGETLSREGFAYPPAANQEAAFMDGWEVKLEHLYVSVAGITVSEDPDKNPTDQSVTGAAVAKLEGQFVADLTQAGPLPGKGEGDKAVELGVIKAQNLAGNKPFDLTKTYAFGYETAPATANAKKVLVSVDADVAEMVQKGYSVLYVGTATFKGTECSPATGAVLDGLPKSVAFRFGFKTKANHVNCFNPDLGADKRGLPIKRSGATVAQITYHADHPFWNASEEDAPLRFDHIAFYAKAKGKGAAGSPVTLEDLVGASITPVRSAAEELTARTCKPAGPPASGALNLETKGRNIADLAAFMTALQVPQAHLNADGLCAVVE